MKQIRMGSRNFLLITIRIVLVHTDRSNDYQRVSGVRHEQEHKRTAWGCRGCGRIPNAEKLVIIWAKIFKIWAKYTATFTRK